jgi:hypothetical protein
MTQLQLLCVNAKLRRTAGAGRPDEGSEFVPAFLDVETGRTEPSRLDPETPAPIHLLCNLPDEWVVCRDTTGEVLAVKPSVVAGFLYNGRFYSTEEAVLACTRRPS